MLAEIDAMLRPVGFDIVIVCCSNQAAENFWCVARPMLRRSHSARGARRRALEDEQLLRSVCCASTVQAGASRRHRGVRESHA